MERSQVTTASVLAVAAGATVLAYILWQRSQTTEKKAEPVKTTAPAPAAAAAAAAAKPSANTEAAPKPVAAPVVSENKPPTKEGPKRPTFSWEKVRN